LLKKEYHRDSISRQRIDGGRDAHKIII